MNLLVIVNNPLNWPLHISGVEVVAARSYLTLPVYGEMRNTKVFNLSRSYRYQTTGYYVSLLAEARGHKPLPSVATLQDMKSRTILRFVSEDLDHLIQRSLRRIRSETFELSIYFGRNLQEKYDTLALNLFNLFQAPLLRAHFVHREKWRIQSIGPIPASEIPQSHRPFLNDVASQYFAGRRPKKRRRTNSRYDLAILHDYDEEDAPSNERALKNFIKAADALRIQASLITHDDYARIGEFDALFIRETTSVNHHTYRFAQRAAAEGLIVVDDPQSIARCANKVYLAELVDRYDLPSPKTMIVHRDNIDEIIPTLGLPCILKEPDSSFSKGVIKVETEEELEREVECFLEKSDLIVAQAFTPTEYDWRVGIFDREPIYVCKYFMARKHWQIIERDGQGQTHMGNVETLLAAQAPKALVRTALRAANLIGDGLYGVDLKQVGSKFCIIEINDNPSIDAGYEDKVLGPALYERIMRVFLARIEKLKGGMG